MGASQLLRGIAVRVHGHDVNVGVTEELVNDLIRVEGEGMRETVLTLL